MIRVVIPEETAVKKEEKPSQWLKAVGSKMNWNVLLTNVRKTSTTMLVGKKVVSSRETIEYDKARWNDEALKLFEQHPGVRERVIPEVLKKVQEEHWPKSLLDPFKETKEWAAMVQSKKFKEEQWQEQFDHLWETILNSSDATEERNKRIVLRSGDTKGEYNPVWFETLTPQHQQWWNEPDPEANTVAYWRSAYGNIGSNPSLTPQGLVVQEWIAQLESASGNMVVQKAQHALEVLIESMVLQFDCMVSKKSQYSKTGIQNRAQTEPASISEEEKFDGLGEALKVFIQACEHKGLGSVEQTQLVLEPYRKVLSKFEQRQAQKQTLGEKEEPTEQELALYNELKLHYFRWHQGSRNYFVQKMMKIAVRHLVINPNRVIDGLQQKAMQQHYWIREQQEQEAVQKSTNNEAIKPQSQYRTRASDPHKNRTMR